MYTRPIFYKIYSIIFFIFAVFGFIGSVISGFIFSFSLSKYLSSLGFLSIVVMFLLVIISALALFFSYIEFSSMFTFAKMIEYEKSNSIQPFKKPSLALSPKFYRSYGSVIFYIIFFMQIIAIIVAIISAFIVKQALICAIPIVTSIFTIVLIYISHYSKYKAFASLLEIVTNKEVSTEIKDNLKKNKPNLLRGYCMFLFVIAILSLIAVVVSIILMFNGIAGAFGDLGTVVAILLSLSYIVMEALTFISLGITGCYFDNLAKMLEHYMIKFNMI